MAINITDLKALAKACLSIVPTATGKDSEIELWINMAIADMKRLGIAVENKISDDLVKGAIMMYVRANFGNVNEKEKALCSTSYQMHVAEMSLSQEYKAVDANV